MTSEIGDTVTLNADLDIYTENDGSLTLNDVVDGGTHSLSLDTESLNAVDGQIDLDGSVEANGGVTVSGGVVTITPARAAVIYDVMGRHVIKCRPPLDSDALAIDASKLAPGIYFVGTSDPSRGRARMVVIR